MMDEVVAGRYRLTGTLGEGAMGVVHRAYDEVLDRDVALKEMRVPAGVDAGEALERFVTEARAAARLSSPSIVTVHDVIQHGDRVLIAMEYLPGATLAEALSMAPGGIAPDQVREVMTAVAGALATAHAQGVVHRDLKPENIFWLDSGRVVVTDFGLARIGAGSGTQLGTVMGTPGYMAPEQIRGEQVGPAADIFAWGVIAHELLVGVPPFGGPELDVTALMWKVVNEPAPSLDLPSEPALAATIDWALRKDAHDRPVDGSVLLEAVRDGVPAAHALTRALDGAAPSPETRSVPPSGRSRGVTAGVVAAVVILIVTGAVLAVTLTSNTEQATPLAELPVRDRVADTRTRTTASDRDIPSDRTQTPGDGSEPFVLPGGASLCPGEAPLGSMHSITGVDADDVLNFRDTPEPDGTIRAGFPEGTGVYVLDGEATGTGSSPWVLVEVPLLPGETAEEAAPNGCAWVNSTFLDDEAPAGSRPDVPSGFDLLTAELFDVIHPGSWSVKRAEELVAGGSNDLRDTTITGDVLDLAIVRVNTTVDQPTNDPSVVMQPILAELRTRDTYEEIGVTDERLRVASGTYDSVRWEYMIKHPSHDVMLHNVNYIIDAGSFSMAVLTRAPVDQFDSLASDFDLIRRSLVIK